ncbi:bifunctional 2-polyprenyl-6-hydroxyphenol methylase/3-demethylubiquinol 3-O-methyltransferase UbiG [Pararhodospirillum oryzae]|uniref:Ubiquinone biosynthesis O-methyltransferase n=1 Tax=Pararhodospirillum oryzae TaxID=478448 RepID=A0A512H629_9PROT|nr:bifunctional 2-polyprenyl-6-hydroxyphenol methylase/3-demethylubiquinol 3-O-methyltransferase UbiG [Pararhodospirillum oryzae]GEO80907.1 ubiquinone biosynthesis O-methyltransferase [Pararhodospirillum oryzae]
MTSSSPSTASPAELAKFSAMADAWWDPEGKFKPLHKFNPLRIAYISDHMAAHFGRSLDVERPFEGLRLLDIGCGGGLVSEPLARLGFEVIGIDAAERNIGTARVHAERSGVPVTYRQATPEDLVREGQVFDAVLTLEVVEHVADVDLFLESIGTLVRPGGAVVAATLNRTLKSLALAKYAAEYVLRWLPRGTHDWRKFMKPSELTTGLRRAGLETRDVAGMTWNPLLDEWSKTQDVSMNYILFAVRAA